MWGQGMDIRIYTEGGRERERKREREREGRRYVLASMGLRPYAAAIAGQTAN